MTEVVSIERVLGFAKETGARVEIAHISTPEGMELLKKAKADAKAAEEAKKTEAEAVLKKLLASGMSVDEILKKLK